MKGISDTGPTTGGESSATPSLTPSTYSRKASGLMRSATVRDVFNFNISNAIAGLVIVWMLLYVPSLYPGANVYLATLIGGVVALPMVLTYSRMSAVFARSGGDYVFNSGVLHPSVGFRFNLCAMIAYMIFLGQVGVYVGGYGIGPLLRVEGIYFKNGGLIRAGNWFSSNPWGLFLIGIIVLAIFAVIFLGFDLKRYFRIQVVLVAAGALSLIVLLVEFLLLSRGHALANIDTLFSGAGIKGISKLAAGHVASFSWAQTYKASLWVMFGVMGSFFASYIGGEVKSPGR